MGQVIAVLNQKGGSGKTTTCLNVARQLQEFGHTVLVADADQQRTARRWAGNYEGEDSPLPPVMGLDEPGVLKKSIPQLKAGYDFILIDGPPTVSALSGEAIGVADFVLIPAQPSEADLWGAEDVIEIIQARREALGKPSAAFVITRARKGTVLARAVGDVAAEMGCRVLSHMVHERELHKRAISDGLTVLDLVDPDHDAAFDVRMVTKDLLAEMEEQSHD